MEDVAGGLAEDRRLRGRQAAYATGGARIDRELVISKEFAAAHPAATPGGVNRGRHPGLDRQGLSNEAVLIPRTSSTSTGGRPALRASCRSGAAGLAKCCHERCHGHFWFSSRPSRISVSY